MTTLSNGLTMLAPAASGETPPAVAAGVLERTARAYLSVFSNPTWNAWRFDPRLDAAVDGRTGAVARTVAQQAKNVLAEAFAPGRRGVFRLLDSPRGVAGFAWGWEATLADLNREKFKLSETDFALLMERTAAEGLDPSAPFFYLSQLGLDDGFRGAGLGKRLVAEVLEGAAGLGLSGRTILRTSSRRDVPFRYFLREGARVLLDGFDQVGNVIMTGPRNFRNNGDE